MFLKFFEALLKDDAEFSFEKANLDYEIGKIQEREALGLKAAEFYKENANSGIGEIARLIAMYKLDQPYQSWDWGRIREISETVISIRNLIQKIDPEAEVNGELDHIKESDLEITAKSGQFNDWSIRKNDIPELQKILEKVDEFSIQPLLDEFFIATFVFKGVRKPV